MPLREVHLEALTQMALKEAGERLTLRAWAAPLSIRPKDGIYKIPGPHEHLSEGAIDGECTYSPDNP